VVRMQDAFRQGGPGGRAGSHPQTLATTADMCSPRSRVTRRRRAHGHGPGARGAERRRARTAAEVAVQHVAAVQEGHSLRDLRGQRQHQRQVGRARVGARIRAQQPALDRRLRAQQPSAPAHRRLTAGPKRPQHEPAVPAPRAEARFACSRGRQTWCATQVHRRQDAQQLSCRAFSPHTGRQPS